METQSSASQLSLSTPNGAPVPLGDYAAPETTTTTSDVDIGLLAELGQAVSRGAEDLHRRWQPPAADSANAEHVAHSVRPVPATAPNTPETAMVRSMPSPQPQLCHGGAYAPAAPETLAQQTAEFGEEPVATAVFTAAGAAAQRLEKLLAEILRQHSSATSPSPLDKVLGATLAA